MDPSFAPLWRRSRFVAYFAGPLGCSTGVAKLMPKTESPGRPSCCNSRTSLCPPRVRIPITYATSVVEREDDTPNLCLYLQGDTPVQRRFRVLNACHYRRQVNLRLLVYKLQSKVRGCNAPIPSSSYPTAKVRSASTHSGGHFTVLVRPSGPDHYSCGSAVRAPQPTPRHAQSISRILDPHHSSPAASRNSSLKSPRLHPQDVLR